MAPTFSEVLEKYLINCEERGLERATLLSYGYFNRSFLTPELGDIEVTDLRVAHFEDLYRTMGLARYDPSTIKKCHTLAGATLTYAEREEWVSRNVARLARTPRLADVERTIPCPADLLVFIDAADETLRDYAWVMANTGMRPGEAVAIMAEDLAADNTLTIRRALDVSARPARLKTTKTRKVRRIVLDDRTAELIRARGGPFVFGGEAPLRQDLLSKRWKRLTNQLGLSFTARSSRHFHATQLIGEGHTTKDVADRLGHANSLITEKVYIQYLEARGAALSGSVAGVLDRARGDAA